MKSRSRLGRAAVESQQFAHPCRAFGVKLTHVILLRWVLGQEEQLILLRRVRSHVCDPLRSLWLRGSNVWGISTFNKLPVRLANREGGITGS